MTWKLIKPIGYILAYTCKHDLQLKCPIADVAQVVGMRLKLLECKLLPGNSHCIQKKNDESEIEGSYSKILREPSIFGRSEMSDQFYWRE